MRRRITTAAAAGALALSLAACGGGGAGSTDSTEGAGGGAEKGDITIGVAMPTETSERWIADGNAVKEGLEKLGYKVDLQYAGDDIPTQTQIGRASCRERVLACV